MNTSSPLFIGLMSGTSLDGVDAILADLSAQPKLIATHALALPAPLRRDLLALNAPQPDELRLACEASVALARLYAQAVHALLEQAHYRADQIRAIGCHGQTIRHRPESGYTLQINQPALLAELTGIDVVADFRSRDVAAGGQGAPLVPAFHAQVLRSAHEHRVILNLGGIANLTDLPPTGQIQGFDTGPANALLDEWTLRHLGKHYDEHGAWAQSGQILPELLARWLDHPFLAAAPPKSCGREEFNLAWLEQTLTGQERPQDIQASLVELTALSAAQAILRECGQPDRVLLCGGGAHNRALVTRLAHHLPQSHIAPTDQFGVPGDWLEAFAFGWLARCTLHREAGNLPEVTGARGSRILGALYPA